MKRQFRNIRFGNATRAGLRAAAFAALAAFAAAPAFAASVPATSAYIQRGLVAQYDGIDNAGTGSHDSSATTWKNLAGDDSSLDGTCDAKLSWNGSNGWTVSGDCKPVVLGAGIAQAISQTNCTVEIACKPSFVNKRFVYFSQYDGGSVYKTVSLENTVAGKYRLFRTRIASGKSDYNWTDITPAAAADTFVSFSFALTNKYPKFYQNGTLEATATSAWGDASDSSESVIGGEPWASSNRDNANFDSTYRAAFNGTYHAFRVYNVTLNDAEIAWNEKLDAVRFNGADAATTLGAEYIYDAATDALTIDPAYSAPPTGTDAADGLKFDISFTGDATADGLTFSASNSDVKHGYATADVALPVLPTVTNAAVNCLFFQQPDGAAAGSIFRQDVRRADTAVTGKVATLFCRFRWDEPAVATAESFPTIVMNGYTSWNNNNGVTVDGFAVRLRCGKGETKGYPIMLAPNAAPGYQNSGITTTGTAYVNAGRWVDMFVSVYPSPTNPHLSNADIWYCEVPSWNANGYFNRSEINHRHFGDNCNITKVDTVSGELRFGCEPNPNAAAITGTDAGKAFRGAIAAAKGWDRLLSEDEMWTVMAGLDGVQSFVALETVAGRTFETCNLNVDGFNEGRNGTSVSFLGGGTENLPRWRSMTTTYNSNTLLWDAPKTAASMPVVYWTKIANLKSGNTHPVHLEVNGSTVWSSEGVKTGDEIKVEIPAELTCPGLNELKWVYDTKTASNWMIFGYHRLRIVTPPKPFVMVIR